MTEQTDLQLLKVQIQAELQRLEAQSSAVEGDHVTVTKGDDVVRAKK